MFWQNVINRKEPVTVVASASPSASVKPAEPQLKSFCAATEKICFDYPADWTVSQTENDGQGLIDPSDSVQVKNDKSVPQLLLTTNISGIGGTCGPDENSYINVFRTHTTRVTGQYLIGMSSEDYTLPTAYAVSAVAADAGGQSKTYRPIMELSTQKALSDIGKKSNCDIGIGVIAGKNARSVQGSDDHGSIRFTRIESDTTYASDSEARAFLTTQDADKAFAVLQSVHYE